ncbi:MAG TPA: transglutaminase domain-containing protein, partial [Planctomycetota bacterium]|nr:transglutaminase domain-containing protein [Planctomycetota bacterium]
IPPGARKVRIWLPLPRTDETQEITNLKVEAPVAHRETRDKVYGNRLAYLEIDGPAPAEIPIKVSLDARRLETRSTMPGAEGASRARLLEGDKLAPVGGEAAVRGEEAVKNAASAGSDASQAKAHAIYNRVLADVSYDKSGEGWGRGDLRHVCEVGKGNCSDFHALFIAMARSQAIPAVFEIGFSIPADKDEGTIGGYHCWAWYEDVPGVFRPVDASEADKDPTKVEYYFGTLCPNRIAFSKGRDIVLEPPQAGDPLNFLIYPHVEVDGKPDAAQVERTFTFKDSKKPD